jgi:hypothetical protein
VSHQTASASTAPSLMHMDIRVPETFWRHLQLNHFVVARFDDVLTPCRRVVTLDAWETVPPGNESALMQVSCTIQHGAYPLPT